MRIRLGLSAVAHVWTTHVIAWYLTLTAPGCGHDAAKLGLGLGAEGA